MLRPAVEGSPLASIVWIRLEAEFGCYRHLEADRSKRLADQFFIGEGAVDFGSVEECDATVDGGADEGDHLLLVGRRAVAEAHPHAAEAESRDFQIAFSEFALLHCCSFEVFPLLMSQGCGSAQKSSGLEAIRADSYRG